MSTGIREYELKVLLRKVMSSVKEEAEGRFPWQELGLPRAAPQSPRMPQYHSEGSSGAYRRGSFSAQGVYLFLKEDHSYHTQKTFYLFLLKVVEVRVKHPENYFCKVMVLFGNTTFCA